MEIEMIHDEPHLVFENLVEAEERFIEALQLLHKCYQQDTMVDEIDRFFDEVGWPESHGPTG